MPDPMQRTGPDALREIRDELRGHLERRLTQLAGEIRHYPTPIARCDLHLGALVEQRSELVAQLQELDAEPAAAASGRGRARILERLLDSPPWRDDEAAQALSARLREALAGTEA